MRHHSIFVAPAPHRTENPRNVRIWNSRLLWYHRHLPIIDVSYCLDAGIMQEQIPRYIKGITL